MIIKLTSAERDTILAALRRWQSYPAAREADSIATGGGKHRPLDNAEIERICKRMTKIENAAGQAAESRKQNEREKSKSSPNLKVGLPRFSTLGLVRGQFFAGCSRPLLITKAPPEVPI